uniref:NIF system FeS cluster assembly NifU N-terminal domain-containing protein n=1 Tax=Physcomitrium patens TaxID=3218 RepID=A0A2K1J2H8_PHYPA|nr:hypothetical protein PHYPA_021577 [Physcomitrium patens]
MLSRFSCGFLPIAVVRQLQRGCGKLVSPKTYHEKVVEHYNNPRNVGSFDKDNPDVGTGLVGAPACGDVMKLQIRVDEKTGKIIDSCFKTFGCGSAIASSSVGMIFLAIPLQTHSICVLWVCFDSFHTLFHPLCVKKLRFSAAIVHALVP